MDEGFDTIYEVVMVEDTGWWVDEEEYKRIINALGEKILVKEDGKVVASFPQRVEFTSVDGFEVTTTTDKIIYLTRSTKKDREANRERNRIFQETEGKKRKQEWEE
jgi:calcineurin-like phosphoesterase family protein